MTQVTPPGWYPDPGQATDGPRSERWWDGRVWTVHTRAVAQAPTASRSRRLRGIAAAVVLVVLTGIGAGLHALASSDGGRADARHGAARTGPRHGRGGVPGSPGPSGRPGAPSVRDGYATDLASGIRLPVPDGWTGQSGLAGAGVSADPYPCPGDRAQQCVRGGADSAPAAELKVTGTTARAAAEEDIANNARQSYGTKAYGSIRAHHEVASGAVEVAGSKGYFVRWKVTTARGAEGYVESLAFPSPAAGRRLVLVRFGIDIGAGAPKVSVIDEITRGIKEADGAGAPAERGQET
ncbi:DUF2510 domain-containing protein [Streptomyces sp. NPDC002004]